MPQPLRISLILLAVCCLGSRDLRAQRAYADHSVLSSGNWYKIAVPASGIYKIDLALLQQLGINTSSLPSSNIRVFGNGGSMLPENPAIRVTDDLQELPVVIEDGNDGILNGSDRILFYAQGPVTWKYDSTGRFFRHQQNLYSRQAFYYIQLGSSSKLIQPASLPVGPAQATTEFDDLWFRELDTFNLLSSGKTWLGEEFSDAPGKTLSRQFSLPAFPAITSGPSEIRTGFAARSFGNQAQFNVSYGPSFITVGVPAVASGPYDLFARSSEGSMNFNSLPGTNSIRIDFTPGSSNSQGWLDWMEIRIRRKLEMRPDSSITFRDALNSGPGKNLRYEISNAVNGMKVWEITQWNSPKQVELQLQGGIASFQSDASVLREFIAFTPAMEMKPMPVGRVQNQDLHANDLADYLLVTHSTLVPQAERLAAFHSTLKVKIVTAEAIFNEFSSGIPDPTAIRDFVKMYYDRAGSDTTKRPKYLLLLGDGSFDYLGRIANSVNLVPVYESDNSFDPLSTYTSDDYFAFLDNGDNIGGTGTPLLDIGVGRIPASNEAQAKAIVDKILAYNSPSSLGPWRNEFTMVADDEDNNLHLEDAETIVNTAFQANPEFNYEKVYLDLFQQESSAGGTSYPAANQLTRNRMIAGNLVWNYNGHGGYRRLAEEVILDQEIINSINNENRLPLFITATCDVAPYDNPLLNSIGENLLLRERTGAIALMTTTRLVFAFSNRIMNQEYVRTLLTRNSNGEYLTLGDAVRIAKNRVYSGFGDLINNRKFTLLGDPAMKIAFPEYSVVTTKINGRDLALSDTLKALDRYEIEGEIRDLNGSILPNFNGTVYPVVLEKPAEVRTLGNDPGSPSRLVSVQKNSLFRGKAKVNGGMFKFSFVVPRDINYQFGKGKISYYAENGSMDANGAETQWVIGGTGTGNNDKEGPRIKAFLNDEKFISGGLTNQQPLLLLKLADSSGINVLGTGLGHDLIAMIDNDPNQVFVLNEFYQSEINSYQQGTVRYQLPKLPEGPHTLTIKAWDVMNNSNELQVDFRIAEDSELRLEHVLNYPNPFTSNTTFWFDHNRPGDELKVHIQVFTVNGKLVKTIRNTILSTGNRSNEVQWDGKDDFGAKLGRGVYIYILKVATSDGRTATKIEKLYLL
jgi:hypothetical protein